MSRYSDPDLETMYVEMRRIAPNCKHAITILQQMPPIKKRAPYIVARTLMYYTVGHLRMADCGGTGGVNRTRPLIIEYILAYFRDVGTADLLLRRKLPELGDSHWGSSGHEVDWNAERWESDDDVLLSNFEYLQ
jgi:hypothetical protein